MKPELITCVRVRGQRPQTFDIGNGLVIFQIPKLDGSVVSAGGDTNSGRILRQSGLRMKLDAADLSVMTPQRTDRLAARHVPEFAQTAPGTLGRKQNGSKLDNAASMIFRSCSVTKHKFCPSF